MPFVGYIHAEDSDPRPEGPTPWEPNWRVWRWVLIALPFAYGVSRADGAVRTLLAFVLFGLACRLILELIPEGGMREYRQ